MSVVLGGINLVVTINPNSKKSTNGLVQVPSLSPNVRSTAENCARHVIVDMGSSTRVQRILNNIGHSLTVTTSVVRSNWSHLALQSRGK